MQSGPYKIRTCWKPIDAIKPKNTTKLKHPGHSKPVPASKSAPIKLKPSRMGWFLVVFLSKFGVPSRFLGFPYSPWIWWDVYTWVHKGLLKFDEVWWNLNEFEWVWWGLMGFDGVLLASCFFFLKKWWPFWGEPWRLQFYSPSKLLWHQGLQFYSPFPPRIHHALCACLSA